MLCVDKGDEGDPSEPSWEKRRWRLFKDEARIGRHSLLTRGLMTEVVTGELFGAIWMTPLPLLRFPMTLVNPNVWFVGPPFMGAARDPGCGGCGWDAAVLGLLRLRFLITSVFRLSGRTTPCSFKNSPQALHRGCPSGLRRHNGVVVVAQLVHFVPPGFFSSSFFNVMGVGAGDCCCGDDGAVDCCVSACECWSGKEDKVRLLLQNRIGTATWKLYNLPFFQMPSLTWGRMRDDHWWMAVSAEWGW